MCTLYRGHANGFGEGFFSLSLLGTANSPRHRCDELVLGAGSVRVVTYGSGGARMAREPN
jgi:hypothetical protein